MNRGRYYSWWRCTDETAEGLSRTNGWAAHIAHTLRLQGQPHAGRRDVTLPLSAPSAKSLKVAFASNLHAGPLADPRLLDAMQRVVTDFAPYVLLLGDDFAPLYHRYISGLVTRLQELPTPMGRFGVLGNHDLWIDDTFIRARLGTAGIQMFVNKSVCLTSPCDGLYICGLDEPGVEQPALDAPSMVPAHADCC